jgi:hypothetical protein
MDGGIIRQIFLLVLGLTYIGLGIFIFFKKILASPWSEIAAILFIAYGAWRVSRSLMKK